MQMKTYIVRMRYRDTRHMLCEHFAEVNETSAEKAKRLGKEIAAKLGYIFHSLEIKCESK